MIDELKRRFSIDSCAIMRGVQSLNPQSNSFLEMTSLNDMAAKYNLASDDLMHEVYQAKRLLDRKAEEGITTPGTLQQVINKLLIYSNHNDSSIHLVVCLHMCTAMYAGITKNFSFVASINYHQ